ncbi:lipid-A-disaccharide synthase [Acidithiobacillus sp. CV18-2]|uniref:Lipid-A-disaccharide synthase n=1 Tax=Igneacidithiobacillus copahuensis TaxID=2724909 RepID=A0AAE2YR49_9PROT|nr:lipid-A-disaccharide synthase [Igneacidithiobacillus copahuensis]MBU2753509.1 lipid-A-disaccharide synthase [Acidithiobacillus sp. CV18-3]MBU2757127.1 lipid-A-disaccharide synthase [Acidithiobacillus sp. BN09-2]MBU2776003.1 lipid-A-disaccharide synthase [Acidithiobacillus sp. CV18-2]MBU2795894.1 lipid-A-disaccharide synthase [Acidithiobacillus sp. VAN18-2]MBU2800320.1 lipid-A-disaccharide synthase [Acidithiobacillus sp. VAN18-4]UTV79849.1 lipid-A-disaccharide synthase [Acidithiobacillus sp
MNKTFVIAVERSGESLGLDLLTRCRAAGIEMQWEGVVGSRLQAAGVRNIADGEVLGVMGLVEVLRHYGKLRRLFRQVRDYLQRERPDAVLLIDHPAFNLRVAREAKRLGIRVLYVVGPQIWAWRQGRIRQIRERIDEIFLLFPFERPLYAEAGIPAQLLPHPLLAQTATAPGKEVARQQLALADGPILALLPGSRRSELQRLAAPMAQAALLWQQAHPDWQIVVALAREELRLPWREQAGPLAAGQIQEVCGQSTELLAAADRVLVASGTATLETALLGRPAIVLYAMQPLTFAIAKRLVRVPHIALPNILLQRRVYPELLQSEITPERVVQELEKLPVAEQEQALKPLRGLLQGDDSDSIAAALRRTLLGQE